MTSQVMRGQTDDDTFFVLVEDTISLQSYNSDDVEDEDESECCLPADSCTSALPVDDSGISCSYENDLNQHFIDEIMSAMEDENILLSVDEDKGDDDDDDDDISNPSRIKEIFIDMKEDININNQQALNAVTLEKYHRAETISIGSCNSDFSNKSFVFVSSSDKLCSLRGSKEGTLDNINDVISESDTCSLEQFNCSSTTTQTDDTTTQTDDTISIDGLDMFEHPTLEYDDTWRNIHERAWQACAQACTVSVDKPDKIMIRELSYEDELQDVGGIDLLAPVFLAITGESDDHVIDMKRKSKSIEDLCSVTLNDGCRRRHRCRPDIEFQQKLKSIKYIKARQCTNLNNVSGYDNFKTSYDDSDGILSQLTSTTIKSHISFDDLHLSSTSSGTYLYECDGNELFEDPDVYIDSVYAEGSNLSGEVINLTSPKSGEVISLTYPEDTKDKNSICSCESWKELKSSDVGATISVSSIEDEVMLESSQHSSNQQQMISCKDKNDLKRSPRCIPGTQCGFLEYPYGEQSPLSSPQKMRRLIGCNTSPESPVQSGGGLHDRIVVNVNGEQRIIDMNLIEPYLKVLSHGGHHHMDNEVRDIVVFTACFLPSKTTENYTIIMEQLTFYCMHAVDLLVSDSYEIVFFNSALESKNMPARRWIKEYYDMICYRLKKNLKDIYFVHQSLWLKAALRFSKLFVSSKFRRKIHLIQNIQCLKKSVPLDYIFIPPHIYKIDETFQ